jgi:hypothetical protein
MLLQTRTLVTVAIALAALAAGASASAAPITLNPLLPSSTTSGTGSNATFIRIDNGWTGSTVLWDEGTAQYGHGQPIGATYGQSWGTGLWGVDDFHAVLSGSVAPVSYWHGHVSGINFGDDCYNQAWSGDWGMASLPPSFAAGVGCADDNGDPAGANEQDNWISYFTGYIRITEADTYNFSVLYDDGFYFNLYGDGATQSIAMDYLNPRDRLGFADDLALSEGLYRFELGAYDRLEAGVVDLRWRRGDETDWSLVPSEHLVSVTEPGTLALFGAGLCPLLLGRRRRARPQHAS